MLNVVTASDQVITPEVSIMDETPSWSSGRIETLPDKTVRILGLIGERIVMQCNVFNMPLGARVTEILFNAYFTRPILDILAKKEFERWR